MKEVTGQALIQSEQEYRSLFDYAAAGMALVSPEGRFVKVNKELCSITGYTEDELKGISFFDVITPNDQWDDEVLLKKIFSGQAAKYEGEKRCIPKNGTAIWVHLTASVIYDDKHATSYLVCQITDTTERKLMERKLQKASNDLNSLFATEIPVSIIAINLEGKITHFNKGAEMLLGYKADELVNRSSPAVFHDHDEVAVRSKELTAILGRDIHGLETFVTLPRENGFESREWTFVRKDGGRIPVQLVISATKDEDGDFTGYFGIAVDITERKEAEQIRRNLAILQSRNKEMEEFTYIASHDLQEPLRTVRSFIDLLNSEYSSQLQVGEGQSYVDFMSGSVTRMSELIKGLLEFSRIGKEKTVAPVDCNVLMKDVLDDLSVAIQESGAVVTVEPLPVIKALPTEMKQLMQNLVSNAIKFRKVAVPPQIRVSAHQIPGYWQFEVSDNGIGIAPRHFQKIFILFQRLHEQNAYTGTGIGLSYCKKIVGLHQGKIWVESAPKEGSRFIFTISNHIA